MVSEECTSAEITPASVTAASLYNYTPMFLTRGARREHGNDCSVYGNANVYGYMRAWFVNND